MKSILKSAAISAVLSAGTLSMAQSHFDNGSVSFDVPEGWAAQTSPADRASVRIKANASANTILIIFDKSLPSDFETLGPAIEKRSFNEVSALFKADTGFSIEQPCPGATRQDLAGKQAMSCGFLLKDAQGYHAMVGYTGIPLPTATCLIVAFSSNYKGDVEAMQAAGNTLYSTINFAAGTPGWMPYDSQYFSFKYPSSWQLKQTNGKGALANDSTGRGISVEFAPGYPNKAGILTQCASEIDLLTEIYKKNFEILDTGRRQYPYTSVTHDNFMPGLLGGQETWITVTRTEAYKKPVTQEVWLNVIPRAGGMYIVSYVHNSEPMEVSEPIRKALAKSIAFKSQPLEKNAYCNYLGK